MSKKTNQLDEDERADKTASGTCEEDQKTRGYYYDDAHGYQKYEPDDDEAEDGSKDEDAE